MADQPIVVQGHHHGYAPARRLPWESGRQTRQVLNVDDVGLPLVEKIGSDPIDCAVCITRFVRLARMKCVVDADNVHTGVRPAPNTELSRVAITVTGKDSHLIAARRGQRGGEIADVDFGPAVCLRWKPVNDLQNAHQIPLVRRSSRPSRTDRAPRYWPSGCATPKAAPRNTARIR